MFNESDFEIDNGTLIKYLGNNKQVTIPDNVTCITSRAFAGCNDLTHLIIPNSVKNIDVCAFEGCTNLAEIIIPNAVIKLTNSLIRVNHDMSITNIGQSYTFIGEAIIGHNKTTFVIDKELKCCDQIPPITTLEYKYAYISRDNRFYYEDNHFKDSIEIICNEADFFVSDILPYAVFGLVMHPQYFSDSEKTKYNERIKKNIMDFYAPSINNTILLKYLLDNRLLNTKDISTCVKLAGSLGKSDAIKLLLPYCLAIKNRNYHKKTESNSCSKSLEGIKFVVSGDLKAFPEYTEFPQRTEIKAFIERHGGKLTGSISGKTNYLICNSPFSSSKKVSEAKSRGIPIISEEEFFEMAGERV